MVYIKSEKNLYTPWLKVGMISFKENENPDLYDKLDHDSDVK